MAGINDFKDFYIAVGQPGAYSNSMTFYKEDVIDLKYTYGILIKHAPFSVMPKIKNVVVQSWKDEDGDDVWLPRTLDSVSGSAITHEAVDYNPTFIIYNEDGNARDTIRNLINRIEGRWLRIFDKYTGIGYDGVYLVDVDDDPKYKSRNYEYVEFTLKFKINGPNIDDIMAGVIEKPKSV